MTALEFAAAGRIVLPSALPSGGRPRKSVGERLAARIDASAGPFGCHIWTGSTMQANGYGQISDISPITGKLTKRNVHVVAWEEANKRRVPAGMCVLHARGCSKLCCNPRHLRLGTHAENAADRVAEGRSRKARLTTAEVLEIVMLHQRDGVSIPALAHRFNCDPSGVRRILRGKTHSKITGIQPHRLKGGGRRKQASAVPAPAPAPIIILNDRRKAKDEPAILLN